MYYGVKEGLTCDEGNYLEFRTSQTLSRMNEVEKLLKCNLCQKELERKLGYYACKNADTFCKFICCKGCYKGAKPADNSFPILTCNNGFELYERKKLVEKQESWKVKEESVESDSNQEEKKKLACEKLKDNLFF